MKRNKLKIKRSGIIIILWLSFFYGLCLAQETYSVPIDSKGNIVEIEVSNNLDVSVNQLEVRPEYLPKWVQLSIINNRIDLLTPNSSGFVKYKFSVLETAELNEEGTMLFNVYNSERVVEQISITIKTTLPKEIKLYQNYPNPFNPSTTLKFSLPENGKVRLVIYDILGREILILKNDEMKAGIHTINFNAQNLSSGVYICQLQVGKKIASRKLQLIK